MKCKNHATYQVVSNQKPTLMPSGPLTVSDITSTSCNLKWKPSEDDGGKPITGYVVEKMDKDTGRWTVCARTDPDVTECPIRGLQVGMSRMDQESQVIKSLTYLILRALPVLT